MEKIKRKTVGEVSLSGTLAQRKICAVITDLHIYGYSRVEPFAIGRLEKDVKDFARTHGIRLESDVIYMGPRKIAHTLREYKRNKGINVSAEELAAFPVRKGGMDKYYDIEKGDFVYADTIGKYVVTPNYEIKLRSGKIKAVNFITATRLFNHEEFQKRNYIKINDN